MTSTMTLTFSNFYGRKNLTWWRIKKATRRRDIWVGLERQVAD